MYGTESAIVRIPGVWSQHIKEIKIVINPSL